MKNFRLIACVLCALVVALLESGCADGPSGGAPARDLRTYAIIAADDQGSLSPTELNSIVDTLVQFLLDQGYVRSDQTLVDDPDRAAAVFRMKIVWNEGRTSFAVVSVISGSGIARVYGAPHPAYATSSLPPDAEPPDALPPDDTPPHAPPPDDWSDDPWGNDDGFGYPYGTYSPFWVWFPLGSYYGHHHHHPPPSFFRRPPDHGRPSEHRTHDWSQYSHHGPSGRNIPDSGPHPGELTRRQSPSRHNGSTEAPHSAPEHRSEPGNSTSSRPQTRALDRSPTQDQSSHRPDPNAHPSPTNPQHKPDPQRTAPPPAAVTPRQPTQAPRSSTPQPWKTPMLRQQSAHTAPDHSSSRPASNVAPAPSPTPQRASPPPAPVSPRGPAQTARSSPPASVSPREPTHTARSSSPPAVPPREPAQTTRSSPPPSVPPREPAQAARSSQPTIRDSVPAERNSPPPVAHAPAPASSSRSDSDSKSKTRDH